VSGSAAPTRPSASRRGASGGPVLILISELPLPTPIRESAIVRQALYAAILARLPSASATSSL
jgi:hypothetical protein